MRTLAALGIRIPADVKMVGVDDASYASYLPTPLTSLRQDCLEIGAVAMEVIWNVSNGPISP